VYLVSDHAQAERQRRPHIRFVPAVGLSVLQQLQAPQKRVRAFGLPPPQTAIGQQQG